MHRKEYQIKDLAQELHPDDYSDKESYNRMVAVKKRNATQQSSPRPILNSVQASPRSFRAIRDLALLLSRNWDDEQTALHFDGLVHSLSNLCARAKETSIIKQHLLSDISQKQHIAKRHDGRASTHAQMRHKASAWSLSSNETGKESERPPKIFGLERPQHAHVLRRRSAAPDVEHLKTSMPQRLRSAIINQSRTQFIVTFLVILFNVHPDLAENGFILLACQPFYGESERRLAVDLDLQCFTESGSPHPEYLMWFIIGLSSLLLVLILPFLAFWLLVRYASEGKVRSFLCGKKFRHKQLSFKRTRHRFGFLYNGYKLDYFWWDGDIVCVGT